MAAWDYAGFLRNLCRDAGPKRCQHSQTARVQSLLHMVQHVADWVAPFPRSQHSPSPPPSILRARELGSIAIIIAHTI